MNGEIPVERVVPKLAKLNFCKKAGQVNLPQSAIGRYYRMLEERGNTRDTAAMVF